MSIEEHETREEDLLAVHIHKDHNAEWYVLVKTRGCDGRVRNTVYAPNDVDMITNLLGVIFKMSQIKR